MANLWGIMHNEEVYPEPKRFIAERFLNEKGTFEKPDSKHFMPFSVGMYDKIFTPPLIGLSRSLIE